ncbi:MAG: cell division protein FtsQ/DivIB [Solirubrobacteraceae bacterium]
MERSLALPIPRGLTVPTGLRRASSAVWRGRRTRIALIAVVIAVPVLLGGFLLLRNSSFVAVEHVQISGVQGAEAPAIEAALQAAAKRMSTLDVHMGPLREAVAPFAVVSSVRAVPSFPHGLHVEVVEQPPVAALLVDGARTAVAADGVVLGPALLSSTLPTLAGWVQPAVGQRLHNATLLEALAVLGAAPRPFVKYLGRVYSGAEGLTVVMQNGLVVYFGDAVRKHAKWLSLARVLADHSSAGATYVDVRLPARPAAGFPAGSGPAAGEASAGLESTASSESTIGALAEGLTKEGGASVATPATEPSSTTEEEHSSEASTEAGASGSGEASEAQSTTPTEASQEAPAAGG